MKFFNFFKAPAASVQTSNQEKRITELVNELITENVRLERALMEISSQRTPGANATVKRMAGIADEALVRPLSE